MTTPTEDAIRRIRKLEIRADAMARLIQELRPTDDTNETPTKPAAPEWDGEGLPPVGCECEYQLRKAGPWFRCEMISHNRMVIRCPHLASDSDSGLQVVDDLRVMFRPIRTQAERDRDDLISEIKADLDALDVDHSKNLAMGLAIGMINRGWRKGDS